MEEPTAELDTLDRIVNLAAQKAVAQAEEVMEEVMRHAIRLVREEVNGRIDSGKKSHEEFKEVVIESLERLAAHVEKQEQYRKDTEHKRKLNTITEEDDSSSTSSPGSPGSQPPAASEEQAKHAVASNSEHTAAVVEQMQKIMSTVEILTSNCEKQIAQIQSDSIARIEVESIRQELNEQSSALRDDFMKIVADRDAFARVLASDIEGLQASLAQQQQVVSSLLSKEYAHLNLETGMNLAEGAVTHSDLESIRATLADLQGHTEENIQLVNSKISEVQGHAEAILSQLQVHEAHSHGHFSQINGAKEPLKMSGEVQEMQAMQSDFVSRSDLEATVEALLSEFQGELEANKEEVNSKISEMHAQLSETKAEIRVDPAGEQLSGMMALIQDMKAQLLDCNVRPDAVTRSEFEARLSELHGRSSAVEESIEKKISDLLRNMSGSTSGSMAGVDSQELRAQLVSKDDLEARASDLLADMSQIIAESTADHLSAVEEKLLEIRMQLSERNTQSDVANCTDVEVTNAALVEMQVKISEVYVQLSEIKDERTNGHFSILEAQLKEMRAQLRKREEPDEMSHSDSESYREAVLSGDSRHGENAQAKPPGKSGSDRPGKIASV